ncbi:Porphobilinogen deaminase [Dermatophilus congolensis]|uniref:Porphobilinogen deaminase n=1 Tax=Dermatophilus congolensis TaxID=1863 RepID=A0AA46BKZ6_9MICO|nr:hydroxymethylbilane synthase [Dermatophilus congolensis]STD02849.1 Porphobilinogen deaminase [Dermatophilus congolensis]
MSHTLKLGTRRSALATTQSRWVRDQLAQAGVESELVEVITEGDINMAPLTQIGGTGVFASALRHRLLNSDVDFAVHSLKDLPVAPHTGLTIAAIPTREDVRDVLISAHNETLEELPHGATIGTGSPRRAAQLHAIRPDLNLKPIRGNVGTRIAHVDEGRLHAVILAGAGIRRLGLTDRISQYLPTNTVLPAAGQGALAIECRSDSTDIRQALALIDNPTSRLETHIERTVLATLEAGCTAPIGVYAQLLTATTAATATGITPPDTDTEPHILLDTFVQTTTGPIRLRRTAPAGQAERLAIDVGTELREHVLAEQPTQR